MSQYRNASNETVQDFVTGKTVEPDGLLDVPDQFDPFYENHPIFEPSAGVVPPAPVDPPVTPTEPTAPVQPEAPNTEQEQS